MHPIRTIIALAALGTAALPQAALAQNLFLRDGDTATVNSAGTQGIVNGMPVVNNTSSYSGGSTPYGVQTAGTSTFTLGTGGTIHDGQFGAGLYTTGSGAITVSGGTITAGAYGDGLLVTGTGPVTISGGTITAGPNGDDVFVQSGTVTIIGGSFIAGTDGAGLFSGSSSSTINLFSFGDTPFLINGVPMNNTTLGLNSFATISGTLLNGDMISTTLINRGIINLNVGTPPAAAPEPSQFAALAIGLLGLGALAFKARKRQTIA